MYAIFINVLGSQIKGFYKELVIAEATETEAIDDFVEIPDSHSGRYMRLSVGDGARAGFVVCGAFDTRVEPA